jgi:hypothetical protein
LASTIGIVPYPKTELLHFATGIFYQSESEPRIRNALRLVNVALKAAGEISETVANALVTSFTRRKAKTSLMEVSLVLKTMADFLKSVKPVAKFLTDMLDDWRGCPLLYGSFHVVYLRFFSSIADDAIPGSYAMDEERHMATVLKSKRPSLVLNGLRQLQMALTSMNDLRSVRIMQNLSQIVLTKFTLFQSVNWAFVLRMPIICRWLIQPVYRSFHQSICDKLLFAIHTSPSLPFFSDYLAWIPAAIRSGVITREALGDLDLLAHVRSPSMFNLALSTLREELNANLARKVKVAIESSLTFLTGHANHQSYYSIV